MTDGFGEEPTITGPVGRRDPWPVVGWALATSVAAAALSALLLVVLDDDSRRTAYHEAQRDNRSIGPTNGRLDDGTIVGAASFHAPGGRICTIYGPPGDRGDRLHCVTDTGEEVDAINWTVDPDRGVDLTVVLVDGEAPTVRFDFDGPTPGHALSWFPLPKPALMAVYVGPPWASLDVETD